MMSVIRPTLFLQSKRKEKKLTDKQTNKNQTTFELNTKLFNDVFFMFKK